MTPWLTRGASSTVPSHTTGFPSLPSRLLLSELPPRTWLLGPLFQRCLPAGISPSQSKASSSKNHLGRGVLMVPCSSGWHWDPSEAWITPQGTLLGGTGVGWSCSSAAFTVPIPAVAVTVPSGFKTCLEAPSPLLRSSAAARGGSGDRCRQFLLPSRQPEPGFHKD